MDKIILQQIQSLEGVKVVELISNNQLLVIFTPEGNLEPVFISDDFIPVHQGPLLCGFTTNIENIQNTMFKR